MHNVDGKSSFHRRNIKPDREPLTEGSRTSANLELSSTDLTVQGVGWGVALAVYLSIDEGGNTSWIQATPEPSAGMAGVSPVHNPKQQQDKKRRSRGRCWSKLPRREGGGEGCSTELH